MTQSLRRTLVVRFAATMAVGLVVASAAIWVAASRVLHHQLDQGLTAMVFIAANEVAQTPHCETAAHTMALDALRYQHEVNRFIVFRDPSCGAAWAIPGWAADLPADSVAAAAARSDRQTFSEARWHDMDMRSTYLAVAAGTTGGRQGVIQVAASLDPVQRLQRLMLLSLVGIVVLGTAATVVGAGRLAASAVRPVREIAEQASHIAAGTLDQRLAAQATAEEYRGLVGVLNGMLDRLSSAFTIQRRFTTDVSHELRTPLTALRGEIEVTLRNERSPLEYQRVLNSALEEIERMTTMTEELLLINRAESRQLTLRREPTDLLAVAQQALDAFRHRIAEKELRTECVGGNGGTHVDVDAGLIRRLLDELVDNAITYTDFGGAVSVKLEQAPGVERVVVEDSGPGIAAADLPHLFDPYYRADQARTSGAGTGLGLTAALAIARLHGGAIRAMNRATGGARFEVDLPVPGRA
ncbi:MAG TPA: ATP-binding protein [Gemmatimonadales bacterium]|nr:ATP-binding protein [Gemmatimonadales bacterium]